MDSLLNITAKSIIEQKISYNYPLITRDCIEHILDIKYPKKYKVEGRILSEHEVNFEECLSEMFYHPRFKKTRNEKYSEYCSRLDYFPRAITENIQTATGHILSSNIYIEFWMDSCHYGKCPILKVGKI